MDGPSSGRLYWPTGGRMVQADPIITDIYNPQNWNPYSYVLNNPLNLTDPSGYSFLSKYWRTIAAIVVTVYTGGLAAGAATSWAAAGWSIGGGFVAGAIQTNSLRGGVYGAFSAGVFSGIGTAFGRMAQAGTYSANALRIGKVVAHGMAGGVMNSLQGGKFGHGFVSAGATQAFSPGIDRIDAGNMGFSAQRTLAAATLGGTVSAMTGGKFANGAVTAAFSRAFNDEQNHSQHTGMDLPAGGYSPASGIYEREDGMHLDLKATSWGGLVDSEGVSYTFNHASGMVTEISTGSVYPVYPEAYFIGGAASGRAIASWGGRYLFGKGALLNSNRYLRIGLGRDGGSSVVRVSGELLGKVPTPIRNIVGMREIKPGVYKWDLWNRGPL